MPEDFRKAYPSTRVIIDCTEVKCCMPSSLLLNSELFSAYKNHPTIKGLVGISPSGAIAVFSPVFRATGKSVFQTGKAARLKILFHPEVEVPS